MLAGRPTSKDIAEKRERILRSYQEGSPDNPGMTEEKPRMTEEKPRMTEEKPGPTEKKVEKKRYYVIMGAFSSRENAERYAQRIKSYGYETEFFGFTEGRTAVGIGGTDDPEEVKAFMKELKGQDFCPEGVWILDRKK